MVGSAAIKQGRSANRKHTYFFFWPYNTMLRHLNVYLHAAVLSQYLWDSRYKILQNRIHYFSGWIAGNVVTSTVPRSFPRILYPVYMEVSM